MNILYLAYAFPPVNIVAAHRALFMAIYMAKAGANVTVICARQSNKRDDAALMEYLSDAPNLSVHWVAPWGADEQKGLPGFKPSAKGLLWVARARRLAIQLEKQSTFDVIYSTYGPEYPHLVARLLSRRLRLPWVAEFRDPWHGGRKHPSTSCGLGVRFERTVLKPAAMLVAVSEGFQNILQQLHGKHRRYEVVYNGYEAGAMSQSGRGRKLEREVQKRGVTVILVGTLYPFQHPSLSVLLEALQSVPLARFVYYGSSTQNVSDLVQQHGLMAQAEVNGLVPHHEVVHQIQQADAAFLPASTEFAGIIPVKYYDYLGSRTPVLMIGGPGTELEQIMKQTDSGASLNNSESVRQWLQQMSTQTLTYSFNGAEFYSRQTQAERLLALLENLVVEP